MICVLDGGCTLAPPGQPAVHIQLLRVVQKPGTKGKEYNPQSDFNFYRPDGTEWIGKAFSPSAVDSYESCPRKWAWRAIDHVSVPSKPGAALGHKTHTELERWLQDGTPPTSRLLVDSGALVHFPRPRAVGMESEGTFAFLYTVFGTRAVMSGFTGTEEYGPPEDLVGAEEHATTSMLEVCFWGRKDVQVLDPMPWVYDLKTTKDLIWAKSEAEL
ncbi:MAG: PD-(D/E)XK nuclease family protein, partial [Phycisphaerales bacterium]